jgi:hypothetical protein
LLNRARHRDAAFAQTPAQVSRGLNVRRSGTRKA